MLLSAAFLKPCHFSSQIREPRPDFYHKSSELFDNPCYLAEVSDVLCIALAELPSLLPPAEVAEALLHVTHGPTLIANMVANQPDCFREGKYQVGKVSLSSFLIFKYFPPYPYNKIDLTVAPLPMQW